VEVEHGRQNLFPAFADSRADINTSRGSGSVVSKWGGLSFIRELRAQSSRLLACKA
jgi:hypothetical protein